MKPKTALDISNMALAKLGEAPIQAFNPNGSKAERMCFIHYHPARREALCAKRWKFAEKCEYIPAQDAINGNMAHPLPTDCLRILNGGKGWMIRGRYIFCNESVIGLKYTADFEDVDKFSRKFVEAFSTLLACKLCTPLNGSNNLRSVLVSEYHKAIM